METAGSKLSAESCWQNCRLPAEIIINRLKTKGIHTGVINMFLVPHPVLLKLTFETHPFTWDKGKQRSAKYYEDTHGFYERVATVTPRFHTHTLLRKDTNRA